MKMLSRWMMGWHEDLRYSRDESFVPRQVCHASHKEQINVRWEEVLGYTMHQVRRTSMIINHLPREELPFFFLLLGRLRLCSCVASSAICLRGSACLRRYLHASQR